MTTAVAVEERPAAQVAPPRSDLGFTIGLYVTSIAVALALSALLGYHDRKRGVA